MWLPMMMKVDKLNPKQRTKLSLLTVGKHETLSKLL